MNAPRFLLMKYVPDLHRFEPRNIGVIVWAPCGVEARFIAEVNRAGDVDGRCVPAFVVNLGAYKQWIRFWRTQLQAPDIEGIDGSAIRRDSPDFVDALIKTGTGDFLVSDAGILLDKVSSENLVAVVDDLYDRLVSPPASQARLANVGDEARDPALDEICDELIAQSFLAADPNFKTGYVVSCAVDSGGKIFESFELSHAYKNGSLKRLYQRVPLSKQKKTLRKTIHDSAWMFEKIAQNNILASDQCASLVYANDEHQQDPGVSQSLRILSSVSRVVNVADRSTALEEFRRLGQSLH